MATLSDLVTVVSGATGLPEATVFAYGRFARQAGLINQKGRGRSAAEMSVTDASNLLIAIAGTGVTKEAGTAIKTFRALRNGRAYHLSWTLVSGFPMMNWLADNLGIAPEDEPGTHGFKIRSDFGQFFDFLLTSILNGAIAKIFANMPSAEIPDDLWSVWQREKSPNLKKSMDELIKLGFAKVRPVTDLKFGDDISLEIKVSQLVPAVEIEFLRTWDNAPEVVHLIRFGPERGAQARAPHDMRLIATLTQHSLAAAAMVLTNKFKPKFLATLKPVDWLFWNQFQPDEYRDKAFKDAKFGR